RKPPIPSAARPIVDLDDPRRTIPGHAVRADGTVLYWSERWRKWKPLKPKVGPSGHVRVRIRVGSRVRELGVARLVLRAFVGPRPPGMEPFHYPDEAPQNCRLENLRWAPIGTSKTGRMLSGKPPRAKRGEEHYHAVLTAADIPQIRAMYRAGFTARRI